MRLRALLVLVFMVVLISPLVLADEEEGEYEAGYGGLAKAGIGLIAVGVAYYALTKRKMMIVHRKSGEWGFEIKPEQPYLTILGPVTPLEIHHALTITGSVLAFVHFFSCGVYTGAAGLSGLGMGITLVLLNVSGFVGRYIYGRVARALMRHEKRAVLRFVRMLGYWKAVHIATTLLFAIFLLIHLAAVD
ncbi:hypothetical protein [Thermococcus sp.]|uniref:hypothetical protein n=1 Tax=Thermococcus sp. TaxID=35749 RepID=UPI0026366786|nr:hypothetical protein [Thermococcus sp.]